MPHLSDEQRDTYERLGYVVLPAVFEPDEIDQMAKEADRIAERVIEASMATGERSPRLDLQRRDGRTVLRKVQPLNDISDVFARYSADERLIGPMREILGCEPVLMEEKLNYKQLITDAPGVEAGDEGESFPFHTDLAFFVLDGYPSETLSSALSIDETTPDNGPLRVLPGSHHRLDWPYEEGWPPRIREDAIPMSDVVDVIAPAGSVMLFHSALIHASSENTTDGPRRIMIYSHYPETHDIEADARNKALREAGRAHEARYDELVAAGAHTPGYRL